MAILFGTFAFLTGFLTAAVELFSRYRDEPFKTVFRSHFGWFYLLLNGILGLTAYLILYYTGVKEVHVLQLLKIAIGGGFGAALIIRARVISAKVGDQDISIGPGYVVDQLLSIIDRQIDRERAIQRTNKVTETMNGMESTAAIALAHTMILGSMQNLSIKDQVGLAERLKQIKEDETGDQEKSYALGFVILDFMGEDYLELFIKIKTSERAPEVIDQLSEVDRVDLVKEAMREVDFEAAKHRLQELKDIGEVTIGDQQFRELWNAIEEITKSSGNAQAKAHIFGFTIIEFLGDDFLKEKFKQLRHSPPPEDPAPPPTNGESPNAE